MLDGGFVDKDPKIIYWMPLVLFGLILVKGIALLISSVGMTWIASQLVMDLRQAMFNKLLHLPASVFDDCSAGALLSKITYDVNRVMGAATEGLLILVRDSLTVMGLFAWMLYLNWQLSVILFVIVPIIIIVVRLMSRQLRGINQAIQEAMGHMTHILEEAINGHKLVKIFSAQTYEKKRFYTTSNQVRYLTVRTQFIAGLSVFIVQMLTALALGIIIYIAALQSMTTVGSFVSLFTAMGLLFAPVKRLTKVNEQLQQGLAAADSVFSLLDQPEEPISLPLTQPVALTGKITFRRLNFAYPSQTQQALTAIDITIAAGETIALVGASGSGKTTFAHLLPHFYPINSGQLFFDHFDITHLPLETLRQHLALVSQDIVLFNDTIAANIAYGAMNTVSPDQIIAAAQAAHALEFINTLPQGFDTLVGERGVKLSGGQRQRLAIARALLKKAPILIFDEATSALDTYTEQQVQSALTQMKQQHTIIIIAHRLSTIVKADRIVVFERGHIIEMGRHTELLAKKGVYAHLYHLQQA